MIWPKNDKRDKKNRKEVDILEELQKVNHDLKCTEIWFQSEKDSDLIDSCIYQREALNAKYKMLLQQAREQNLISSPFKKKEMM